MEQTRYRICVRGRVSERLGSALGGMRREAGAIETAFTGEIRYELQLYGLLDRVRDLGLDSSANIRSEWLTRRPTTWRRRDDPRAPPPWPPGISPAADRWSPRTADLPLQASPARSTGLRLAAVVAALTSSPRQAVGDVTAIHASANFSDPRRHAPLPRFTSPDAVSQQPRTRKPHRSPTASSVQIPVRRERRQPITNILTMGTYRGARNF